jgi:hypothetical protein
MSCKHHMHVLFCSCTYAAREPVPQDALGECISEQSPKRVTQIPLCLQRPPVVRARALQHLVRVCLCAALHGADSNRMARP